MRVESEVSVGQGAAWERSQAMDEEWIEQFTDEPQDRRVPAIRGGALAAVDELRLDIRARLLDEALPCIDGRASVAAGSGTNRRVCCRRTIETEDREYQPAAGASRRAAGATELPTPTPRADADEPGGDEQQRGRRRNRGGILEDQRDDGGVPKVPKVSVVGIDRD